MGFLLAARVKAVRMGDDIAHPSARELKNAVVIISCKWNYEKFCFHYSAQPLEISDKNNLQTQMIKFIKNNCTEYKV